MNDPLGAGSGVADGVEGAPGNREDPAAKGDGLSAVDEADAEGAASAGASLDLLHPSVRNTAVRKASGSHGWGMEHRRRDRVNSARLCDAVTGVPERSAAACAPPGLVQRFGCGPHRLQRGATARLPRRRPRWPSWRSLSRGTPGWGRYLRCRGAWPSLLLAARPRPARPCGRLVKQAHAAPKPVAVSRGLSRQRTRRRPRAGGEGGDPPGGHRPPSPGVRSIAHGRRGQLPAEMRLAHRVATPAAF